MSKTQIADIIVPTEFERYAIERTAELSNFGRSGIIEMSPRFSELASMGGKLVPMPFWKDLSGARQILSDSASLSVNKITADQDQAFIHNDANAWSINDLAEYISGGDPMGALLDLVAQYWGRIDEGIMTSSLKGVSASASMAGNKLSIASESIAGQSASTRLNGSTFVDATHKLGDRAEAVTAVAMHSAVEGALIKLDLIDHIPDSQGKAQLKVFQGRRVVVDDNLPVRAGTTDGLVYTTYLFGPGAFGKGSARLEKPIRGGFGTEGVELARVALDSDSVLVNRRHTILHPRGVRFTAA